MTPVAAMTAAIPFLSKLPLERSSCAIVGANQLKTTPIANTKSVVVDEYGGHHRDRRQQQGEANAETAAEVDQLVGAVDGKQRRCVCAQERCELSPI